MENNIINQIIQAIVGIFSKGEVPTISKTIELDPATSRNIPQPATEKPSFRLTRKQFRSDGIFSELTDKDGKVVAQTLEHSYDNLPKIPYGIWKCVRGPHRLHGMTQDFITFEITGIIGHSNLLFHWGNYNKDSEGCVLLGEKVASIDNAQIVTNSRNTFAKFMASLEGVNEFELTVS